MNLLLRANWWKIIGVVLIVCTIIAGFLVPLKPGIEFVEPNNAQGGEKLVLSVQTYNAHLTETEKALRAWLKIDDEHSIAADSIIVQGVNQLKLLFEVPARLPSSKSVQFASLILDNPVDGPSILPDAVAFRQKENANVTKNAWTKSLPENLHVKKDFSFPYRNILAESIRNTYFHVALWLAMVIIFLMALVNSIRYLRTSALKFDHAAIALTQIGTLYGILGIATGMIWAKNTWGAFWPQDVKLNMTAIALLIYLAYFVLRSSLEDPEKRARVAAVYNIFSFSALIPLIYIIPRLNDSLHPGMGGNPALGGEDLDNTMRMVFYPAIIGWTLIGLWMAGLSFRITRLQSRIAWKYWAGIHDR